MSTKQVAYRVSQLYQPHSYWISESAIILKPGEIGVDSTYNIYKIGDGVSTWNEITQYYPFIKEDGTSVLDGGLDSYEGTDNPVTIKLATEESFKYSREAYIPLKGEPISELNTDDLQGIKIGDGRRSFKHLNYVTPYDDAVIENYGEVEDFNV